MTQNLNNLASVITRAQTGCMATSRKWSATSRGLNQILGNFEETLRDCCQLLEDKSSYGKHRGFVYNLQWYIFVKEEVEMLRDRIAFLNIKVRPRNVAKPRL